MHGFCIPDYFGENCRVEKECRLPFPTDFQMALNVLAGEKAVSRQDLFGFDDSLTSF